MSRMKFIEIEKSSINGELDLIIWLLWGRVALCTFYNITPRFRLFGWRHKAYRKEFYIRTIWFGRWFEIYFPYDNW